MAEKQKKKSKGRFRSFITKAVVGIICISMAVSFVRLSVQINEVKRRLDVVEAKNAEKEVRVEELKELNRLIDEGKDKDYIARIAREHGYADPNEKVYKNGKNG